VTRERIAWMFADFSSAWDALKNIPGHVPRGNFMFAGFAAQIADTMSNVYGGERMRMWLTNHYPGYDIISDLVPYLLDVERLWTDGKLELGGAQFDVAIYGAVPDALGSSRTKRNKHLRLEDRTIPFYPDQFVADLKECFDDLGEIAA